MVTAPEAEKEQQNQREYILDSLEKGLVISLVAISSATCSLLSASFISKY
jgi:hypothetical protein